ncbi:MAG: hypothetical protein SRB1_02808 [Desulfobacteraceae bacterium Eth-SRB1]|nr:MAG: hypothetical protein SRB1_02808 [Desulfobacteraceae bacterium Eth-SRB1]
MVYNSKGCLLTISKKSLILIPVLCCLLFSVLNSNAANDRFQDHRDGTITDRRTGLMWSKNTDPAAGSFNWFQAVDAVAGLNAKKYCGYRDWRLPDVNELASLVDRSIYAPSLPRGHPFLNIKVWYWTGTTTADHSNHAWRIYFFLGNIDYGHKQHMLNHVWPVRASDYGVFSKGKARKQKRFYDNGNGTVTDSLSGLMWTKNANLAKAKIKWPEARKKIRQLNAEKHSGYNDWQLPGVDDLRTLIDYKNTDPVICDHHPFIDFKSGSYWSSEINVQSPYYIWCVDFKNSRVDYYNRVNHVQYVWAVRDSD